MFKKPIINAFSASVYIIIVAGIFNLVARTQGSKPDTFFAPVAVLSLFTLSVAVMAYLFFLSRLPAFYRGKEKEGHNFLPSNRWSFWSNYSHDLDSGHCWRNLI